MSKNEKVHLVLGLVSYEGSDVLKAFLDKDKAQSFLETCREYPSAPNTPLADAADEEWEEWDRRYVQWRNNHPTRENGHLCDGFALTTVELDKTKTKSNNQTKNQTNKNKGA